MTVALYRQFCRVANDLPRAGQPMPYNWTTLPNSLSIQWMPYALMLDEFARELANTINTFTENVHRLKAWAVIIEPLSEAKRLRICHDFIDTIATNAVNLPFVVKARFGFASAHLCHQANMLNSDTWVDDLPFDTQIQLHTADHYGKEWTRYRKLKAILDQINGKSFCSATCDFRNSYNHRFSPRFVFGHTQLVSRSFDDNTKHISYSIGDQEPLSLPDVVIALEVEQVLFHRAFVAFQQLVEQHLTRIATQKHD